MSSDAASALAEKRAIDDPGPDGPGSVAIRASASEPGAAAPGRPTRRRRSALQQYLTPKAEISRRASLTVSIAIWVIVLAVWAWLTYGGVMPDIFLPTPGSVVSAFFRLLGNGTLAQHVFASVEVVLLGFIISSLVAVPLGILMGTFRIVEAAIEPLVNFLRYLPAIKHHAFVISGKERQPPAHRRQLTQ